MTALLIGEAVVRLTGMHAMVTNVLRHDQDLGWSLIPGAEWEHTYEEKPFAVSINRSGFRGPDYVKSKPEGVRRIVVIGDSFTEALQLSFDETYHQRLQEILQERTDGKWEVIPIAAGGWGTAQELLALKKYGLAYDPDIVVLQFFALNDICDNTISAADICLFSPPQRPYLTIEHGIWKQTYVHPIRSTVRNHCKLCAILEQMTIVAYMRHATPASETFSIEHVTQFHQERADRIRQEEALLFAGELFAFAPATEQAAQTAAGWPITESLIEEMDAMLEHLRIPLVIVSIPTEKMIDNATWEHLERTDPSLTLLNINIPDNTLKKLSSTRDIPLVTLMQIFSEHRDVVLPYIGGHLNRAGHELTAEALYTTLNKAGLIATMSDD